MTDTAMDAKTDAATRDAELKEFARLLHNALASAVDVGASDDEASYSGAVARRDFARDTCIHYVTGIIAPAALAASRATSEPTDSHLAGKLDLALALGAVHHALDPEADADGVPYQETVALAKRVGREVVELRRILRQATVRIEILRNRMEGCHDLSGDERHKLSREEAIAWIEEQKAFLAGAPHTGGRTT